MDKKSEPVKQRNKIITISIMLSLLITFVAIMILFYKQTTQLFSTEPLRAEFANAYEQTIQSNGNVFEMDITASEGELEIFDGYKTKVWNYNDSVPGPEIRLHLGDTLKVNFTNNLPQETTIHWHGIRVPHAMDGVPGINQDPIKPGERFVYEFTPKDAGTFWFHPHVRTSEQLERGLYGTIIVEDDISKQYSKDVVWVLDDWLLTEDNEIYPEFVTRHDLAHDGRWGNVITINGNTDEVLNVSPGERIILRMVNSSNARVYKLNVGLLDAKIIAVDGMYTKEPLDPDGFEISPGNRVDLDIKISTESEKEEFNIYDNYTRYTNKLASIKVSGEPVEVKEFDYPSNPLVPEWKNAIEAPVDKEFVLDAITTGPGMMGEIKWTINGKAYPDYEPFELNYNEFNKIKFTNESYRLHPMHIHAQFFKVISRNGRIVEEPFFRDTVLVGSQETIEIGIVPLDEGKWVSHCHIQEHADAGMMTVIEVK